MLIHNRCTSTPLIIKYVPKSTGLPSSPVGSGKVSLRLDKASEAAATDLCEKSNNPDPSPNKTISDAEPFSEVEITPEGDIDDDYLVFKISRGNFPVTLKVTYMTGTGEGANVYVGENQ